MDGTLVQALNRARADIDRTAAELGADSTAVLLNADQRVEITWFRSGSDDETPDRQLSGLQKSRYEALIGKDRAIAAGTPLALFLRETISRHSHSFLVYRWGAVDIVFGFADAGSLTRKLPETVVERLNLIGLATWSANEIARLRAELKTANGRLAARKLVERAKGVLQAERGISEGSAYEYLRGQSRKRRITLAKIAEEVVRTQSGVSGSQYT